MEYIIKGAYTNVETMRKLKAGDIITCNSKSAEDLVCRNLSNYAFRFSRIKYHNGVKIVHCVRITEIPANGVVKQIGTKFGAELIKRMHKAMERV